MNILNLVESCVGGIHLKPEFTAWGRTAEAKKKKKSGCIWRDSIWIHSGWRKESIQSVSLLWQGAETSSSTGHSLPGKNSPACWLITTQQFIYNIPHWVSSGEFLLMQASHTCPETQGCCAAFNQPAGSMFALPSSACHESNWRWWLVWLAGYGEVSLLSFWNGVILLFRHKQEEKKLEKLLWAGEKKRWVV